MDTEENMENYGSERQKEKRKQCSCINAVNRSGWQQALLGVCECVCVCVENKQDAV